MTADEMTDNLEFDQQITTLLEQANGQQELLKFVAKEVRNVNIRVSDFQKNFATLLVEHNERMKTGASCTTAVTVSPAVIPKKLMAVAGGISGGVTLILLIIFLLILKSMGFSF